MENELLGSDDFKHAVFSFILIFFFKFKTILRDRADIGPNLGGVCRI